MFNSSNNQSQSKNLEDAKKYMLNGKEMFVVGSRVVEERKAPRFMSLKNLAIAGMMVAALIPAIAPTIQNFKDTGSFQAKTEMVQQISEHKDAIMDSVPAVVVSKVRHFNARDSVFASGQSFKGSWGLSKKQGEGSVLNDNFPDGTHQLVLRTLDMNSDNLDEVNIVVNVSRDVYHSHCKLEPLVVNDKYEYVECTAHNTPLTETKTDFQSLRDYQSSIMFMSYSKDSTLLNSIKGGDKYELQSVKMHARSDIYVMNEIFNYNEVINATASMEDKAPTVEQVFNAINDTWKTEYQFINSSGDNAKLTQGHIDAVNGMSVKAEHETSSIFRGNGNVDYYEAHVQTREDWDNTMRATHPVATVEAKVKLDKIYLASSRSANSDYEINESSNLYGTHLSLGPQKLSSALKSFRENQANNKSEISVPKAWSPNRTNSP